MCVCTYVCLFVCLYMYVYMYLRTHVCSRILACIEIQTLEAFLVDY
jgi:hypothetical protein